MPIPQFHRTPKTRKRRTRRSRSVPEFFDPQDMKAEVVAENGPAAPSPRDDAGEAGALPHSVDADDPPPPSAEEVPALLSTWPPRRSG